MNDRELKLSEVEFERQSKQTAWIVTVVFHLCALLPMVFITCSPAAPEEELTQIVGWGGSGGNPDVNAPVGQAPKGDPNATGGSQSTPQNRTEQKVTTPTQPKQDLNDKAVNEITQPNQPSTPSTNNQSGSTSSEGTQNTQNSGQQKGQPDGEGTKPAGGSGGSTVGVGTPGIGRCWSVSPSQAARKGTTNQDGSVTIRCIVKWDGTLTGIQKVSGSTTLYAKARQLLAGARACRAAPGTPDVEITLNYTFKLY